MLSFAGRLANQKVGDRFALDLARIYKRTLNNDSFSPRKSTKLAHDSLNMPQILRRRLASFF